MYTAETILIDVADAGLENSEPMRRQQRGHEVLCFFNVDAHVDDDMKFISVSDEAGDEERFWVTVALLRDPDVDTATTRTEAASQ